MMDALCMAMAGRPIMNKVDDDFDFESACIAFTLMHKGAERSAAVDQLHDAAGLSSVDVLTACGPHLSSYSRARKVQDDSQECRRSQDCAHTGPGCPVMRVRLVDGLLCQGRVFPGRPMSCLAKNLT
jgi:hypothetical protein